MKWIFVALATLLSSGLSHAAVIPIYGMAPVRRWREVTCRGRGKSRLSYWVNTLDDETCVIAVYCG